eukprot:TRINITY_DN33475_c0_g1_i1.p1 TRINITY_DN33475_c0_g1~~TRINITY_DN33475_c0_g1_i1.p1  ORF type:complete len:391 (-),score=15.13 TRINITY_DN33475_c0_g1_i1:561-1733(-)
MNSSMSSNESSSSSGSSDSSGNIYGAYDITAHFNPSMAIIIVVLLSAFFFMGFFSIYVRRCAGEEESTRNGGTTGAAANRRANRGVSQGLDKNLIETFPIYRYSVIKGLKKGKDSMECAVCLSEFEEDETLRLLPRCGHSFHTECIDIWLSSHTTCPLCRRSLLPAAREASPPPVFMPRQEQVVIVVENEGNERNVARENRESLERRANTASNSPIFGVVNASSASFRRSHSTGHSLMRLSSDLDHPSRMFISTVGREGSGFPATLIESGKAGLHRSNSSSSGHGVLYLSEDRERERLWMFPSSTGPSTHSPDGDAPSAHSDGRFVPRRGLRNPLFSPRSPFFVRALSERRYRGPRLTRSSTSAASTSHESGGPRNYLETFKSGLRFFKG